MRTFVVQWLISVRKALNPLKQNDLMLDNDASAACCGSNLDQLKYPAPIDVLILVPYFVAGLSPVSDPFIWDKYRPEPDKTNQTKKILWIH